MPLSPLGKEEVVNRMLEEFGLDPEEGHIINGHVPVHQLEGENPVKCDGKVIVIDGGFCEAYRNVTGIAGYTLVYSSYGLSRLPMSLLLRRKMQWKQRGTLCPTVWLSAIIQGVPLWEIRIMVRH